MPDNDPELAAKRESAAYRDTINKLRIGSDLSPEEMDRLGIQANDHAVYGHDAKKDRNGNYIQQGVGAPGRETGNHFMAIRRYQGEQAWKEALREIWNRDPQHAERLRLPKVT